ncbi:MAG: hypothetical protein JWR42_491, partial [Marmoricola sp.]|nr:hypothetical protein [Marmoricola sp.]
MTPAARGAAGTVLLRAVVGACRGGPGTTGLLVRGLAVRGLAVRGLAVRGMAVRRAAASVLRR